MIKIRNITKSFDGQVILDNLSFDIKGITAIKSASGSGKTTLINIILGFISADFGEITGDYEDVAVVFQEDRLIEDLTAIENLLLVCKDRKKCENMLNLLGISADNKKCYELSGGMKRRVSLARAFLVNKKFIILDEPFTGLDDINRQNALDLIKEVAKSKTILLITHNEEDIKHLMLNLCKVHNKIEIYQ